MKYGFWFGLLYCLALPVAAGDDLAARIHNAKLQDAAFRAVEESIDALRQHMSSAEDIAAAMLAQPAAHGERAASEARLRIEEHDKLYTAFREQLDRFAASLPDLPVNWSGQALRDNSARIEQTVAPLLQSRFGEAFNQGRALAVTEQMRQLDVAVAHTPTAEEIEQLVDGEQLLIAPAPLYTAALVNTQPAQALVARYVLSLDRKHDLFEENQRRLTQRVAGVIGSELQRLQTQLLAVTDFSVRMAADRVAAEALEQAMLEQAQGQGGALFPSVRSRASKQARVLERALLRDYVRRQLDAAESCPALPAEQVAARIASERGQLPQRAQQHMAALLDTLAKPVQQRLAQSYAQLHTPMKERPAFAERVADYLAIPEPEGLAASVRDGMLACIGEPLEQQRLALARQELDMRASALAAGSLELGDDDLAALRGLDRSVLQTFSADSITPIDDWQLEESRRLWDEARLRLLTEGKFAIESQISLVSRWRQEFVEQVRRDPQAGTRRHYWQAAYEQQVLSDWRALRARESAPEGVILQDGKYDRIAVPVAELITDVLTLAWEEKNTAEEVADTVLTIGSTDCGTAAELCQQASSLCFEAVNKCSARDRESCLGPIARCRDAKQRCEEMRRKTAG